MITLRPYQVEAVESIMSAFESANSTLLVLPTGCHDPRQKLLGYGGFIVEAQQVRENWMLTGPDGGVRRVLKVHEGRAPMARVIPVKGEPFIVTMDHMLTLVRTRESSDPKYPCESRAGEIVDVRVCDWLAWPKWRKHVHKLFRVGVDFADDPAALPIDPYVLGLLLGDGSFRAGLSFTSPDREAVDAVRAEMLRFGILLAESQIDCGKAICWLFRSVTGHGHECARLRHEVLEPLGLNMAIDDQKRVPSPYRTANRPARLALLAGLMDSDGHLATGGYDYISKSRRLSEDCAFVARSLGLAAYVSECQKFAQTGGGGTYWRVSISGDCSILPCRIPHKKAPERRQKKSVLRTGFTVEPCGEGDYIGFTVDGDNRYLLDDFTVTHNCGKTTVFVTVAERFTSGRVLILAHREELIFQAAERVERMHGTRAGIEMAEMQATGFFGHSRVVVSSIQTQCAGRNGGRMKKFSPDEFSLVIIDEAHHGTASTYRRVIDYYRQNPKLKVLGVTATPDRADEEALGQIFESVAYDYEVTDAIRDGWLVPIQQRAVHVEELDYSSVRTTAGDLNGADLAQVMEYESALHGIAAPTIEIVGDRKALVFAASLAHAERLCEIFNRHRPDCARWISGTTTKEDRRKMISDYAAGRYQYLVNVGVATEGFDDPGIEVVVMGRPTKSRALYAQMAGRGTRPLPGLVDGEPTAEERRLAVSMSAKPYLEIIDFVGNSGRHKLMTTADILGGKYSEQVIAKAKDAAEAADADGEAVDMANELAKAQKDIEAEQERAKRAALRLKARYSSQQVDPFDVLQVQPWQERGWDKGKQPSEKMLAFLEKQGISTHGLSFVAARQLIQQVIERRENKQATFKQARILRRYGYDTAMSFEAASKIIDGLAANGWKAPERKEAV